MNDTFLGQVQVRYSRPDDPDRHPGVDSPSIRKSCCVQLVHGKRLAALNLVTSQVRQGLKYLAVTDDHDFMRVDLSRPITVLDPQHNLLVGSFAPIMQRKNCATAGEDAGENLDRVLMRGIGRNEDICFTVVGNNNPGADERGRHPQRAEPRKQTQSEAS